MLSRSAAELAGSPEKGDVMGEMNMQEMTRLLLGLRAAGWDEKEINDFLLYIQTGEKQYEPRPKEKLAG